MDYESSLCSGCGRPRHETFDPANEQAYEAEAQRCHACATRDRKTTMWREDENADTSGVYFAIHERDD